MLLLHVVSPHSSSSHAALLEWSSLSLLPSLVPPSCPPFVISLPPPSSLRRFPSPRFHSPPPPRFHVLSTFLILHESPRHRCVPLPCRYAILDSLALGLTHRSWHVGDPSFVIVIVERGMAVRRTTSAAHIPLERGGAIAAGTLTAVAGALVVEPTSLRGGEGLAAGLLCVVGRELGWRGW